MFISNLLMLVGIALSGLNKVHWFMYFVPAFFLFAAATGLCVGLVIPRLIFGKD